MVILYDDGDDSDEILQITSNIANNGNFNLIVVGPNRNTKIIDMKKHESNNNSRGTEYPIRII